MPKKRPEAPRQDGDVPATELQRRFGYNLRVFRQHAGLTQTQVSNLSGIAQADISLIERGQVNLSLVTMQRLAKVVDHNVSNLLAESPELPPKK